jgi:hypothetical protein
MGLGKNVRATTGDAGCGSRQGTRTAYESGSILEGLQNASSIRIGVL